MLDDQISYDLIRGLSERWLLVQELPQVGLDELQTILQPPPTMLHMGYCVQAHVAELPLQPALHSFVA